MHTLFDPAVAEKMLQRVESLTPASERQWGKMSVDQMLAHCAKGFEMAIGIIKPKRVLIGRILGPLIRKKYSDESEFGRNSPTGDELRITTPQDFEQEKKKLLKLLRQFSSAGEKGVTNNPHPFFGKLTATEWGIGMYKHLDHHLRQFGG
ncbi:MAG: DUF1569 domain-containing protein [Cyclobacteriaceae bacterium]|nr:DUF1569 domain-containing protein [Cyclobacteriaceae bacterium]